MVLFVFYICYYQILEFYENRSRAKVETIKWIAAIKDDLKAAGITQIDISDRNTFRQKIFNWKVGQGEPGKMTGTTWSDERKRIHSERMKQVWAQRKINSSIKTVKYFMWSDQGHT